MVYFKKLKNLASELYMLQSLFLLIPNFKDPKISISINFTFSSMFDRAY
jgi:hypothetical protein